MEMLENLLTILWENLPTILIVIAGGLGGYFFGSMQFFKEDQHRMYGEALPHLLEFAFSNKVLDEKDSNIAEKEINVALSKVWLYASSDIAKLVDDAVSKKLFPKRGEFIPVLQEAIAKMRKDIQPWWRFGKRKLDKKDIQHFYITRSQMLVLVRRRDKDESSQIQ